ncbi:MAG: PAS domain S-box protein, partial [Gemmataceae bacterium]
MSLVDNPEVARCLFREAIDAQLLIDPRDSRVLDANPAALRLTGLAVEAIVQLCIPDLFEPPDHGKALADPFGEYDGYRMRGAGGRLVPVQVTASRLPTAPAPLALLVVREVRGQGTSDFHLAEDEGRVRDLFSVSPDAIFVEDLDGTILDVNAKACRLHGEPRERLVGRNVLELVPAEQRDQVRASFPRLVSGELTFVEGFSRTADGRAVPVELRVSRVHYQGRPALLLHVRDVTPRKRAEESLRESKRFIERIAEASPHIMYVFDLARRQNVYANRLIARDLGYSPEEVRAMGDGFLPRLLHPDDLARLEGLLRRWESAHDGEVLETEYRMRHRDGSWHWFVGRDTVFSRGPGGEVTQFVGTAEDVTGRKRAEQEVLASKRMLEAVINNIPQGVFWKDGESRYLGCNRVMAEAFGLGDPADIVGRTPFDMPALTPEQAASSLAEDRRVIEGGEGALDFDQAVTRADGSTIWLETSKLPLLDANGRVAGVIGTWQDVTERKRAQEALQRRNRLLASLSRCQARFIAGENQSAIFQELLLTLLEATGSEYGLLGEVLGGEDGLRYLKTLAITDISWDEGSSRLYRESKGRGLEFRNLETLFGAVITTGVPVLTNDPASHPGSGGLPPGHPPLRSFLGLPFHQGQEVVGMVGVANRPGGYDEGVVALLEPFLNTCAGLLVAARTAHARRTAEAQVRASERRYLTTLASIGDAVIATDPAGRVTFLNPVAEALTGWACAEAAGRPLDEVLPLLEEQSRRPVENPAGQALRLRAAVGLANGTLLLTRHGQEVPNEDSAAPIGGDDGEVQGVVLVFRDVTARRQAEEERRRLEAQLLHAQKLESLGVLAGG